MVSVEILHRTVVDGWNSVPRLINSCSVIFRKKQVTAGTLCSLIVEEKREDGSYQIC